VAYITVRPLPKGLEPLAELALDLRWSWSHGHDVLWCRVSPEIWEATENPWVVLQEVSRGRLEDLARDAEFLEELRHLVAARSRELSDATWYSRSHPRADLGCVAYFSMEFGLGEALPLYAGGLGILAGDHLKAASDLGVPVVGVGLLYQEGYFRQMIDSGGAQQEAYPYNDPAALPVVPALAANGSPLRFALSLPGRRLGLRVWQARVGRTTLYLLDSNDPLNGPFDRGITGKLYGGGPEMRLLQEIVLGIGGWRALKALGIHPEVCHLNEGHAAFAALARAQSFMEEHALSFDEAMWATRAGNVLTTHTPVAAGFDVFAPALVEKNFRAPLLGTSRIPPEKVLAMGRRNPLDPGEPLNMAYLAVRCSSAVNAVSRLHGEVSRRLLANLFPRWPVREVPVEHVTNGVHVPSWDSASADRIWTRACGKGRWLGAPEALENAIHALSDADLWAFRSEGRRELVRYARERLAAQLGQRGEEEEAAQVSRVLDPDALTIGFARRFAEYKRPNLLLTEPKRLARLLDLPGRPVQVVVAGKAHPADEQGKELVRAWVEFVHRPEVRRRAVFLEDYDMALAQKLVEGVDLWINTPRRPWEACGTSGMKVLVNGGLNLSELDGWWAEAYQPEVGWALGDGAEHAEPGWDAVEADQLYRMLEQEVIPAFYDRGQQGVPAAWVARMRASMARLAPRFSTNRMMGEYLERLYLPAAHAFRSRSERGGALARELARWSTLLDASWEEVRFGGVRANREDEGWRFEAEVDAGGIPPEHLRVELYAEPSGGAGEPVLEPMSREERIAATSNGWVYRARVQGSRAASDYTVRIIPSHDGVRVPIEERRITWQR